MKTIARNRTRKIAEIQAAVTSCRVFQLRDNFAGTACDQAQAWDALARYDFARLVETSDGAWSVNVHSNLWYELRSA